VTAAESCELLVAVTRELALTRAERAGYRLVAVAAIHHAHDLQVELERLRSRYHALLDERRTRRTTAGSARISEAA
jgi:hypothetical protein